MPFDIDQTMLVYLGMITAGIFIFPFWSDTLYLYQIIGTALVAAGGFLVYRKSRKR
ncbi:MAG: LPXTG cell wall anchor domain-containing protein [Nitrosotalea sp.]